MAAWCSSLSDCTSGSASKQDGATQYRIMMVGQSGCGQTTILDKFKSDVLPEKQISTCGINIESIYVPQGKSSLIIWDIGGSKKFRESNCKGIIHVAYAL